MKSQRGYYNMDFTGLFVFLGVLGVAVGVFLSWFIPIVWGWLKPFIHTLTA